jgi:hypothetical protein
MIESGIMVGRGGFELPTFRLSVERSSQAELPAPTFRGDRSLILCGFIRVAVNLLKQLHC